MRDYTAGQIARITATFIDDTGQVVDPTTVTFWYSPPPAGPPVSIEYISATVPAVGTVARTGPGVYVTWIDTTGLDGIVTYEVVATGIGQTVSSARLNVVPAAI